VHFWPASGNFKPWPPSARGALWSTTLCLPLLAAADTRLSKPSSTTLSPCLLSLFTCNTHTHTLNTRSTHIASTLALNQPRSPCDPSNYPTPLPTASGHLTLLAFPTHTPAAQPLTARGPLRPVICLMFFFHSTRCAFSFFLARRAASRSASEAYLGSAAGGHRVGLHLLALCLLRLLCQLQGRLHALLVLDRLRDVVRLVLRLLVLKNGMEVSLCRVPL
jgi:hypothetical protein